MLKKTWTVTWKIILFLTLWGVLYAPAVLGIAVKAQDGGAVIGPGGRVVLEFFGALAVITAAWILVRFVDRRDFAGFGFAPGSAVRDLLIGLFFGLVMIAVAVAILFSAGWVEAIPILGFSWSGLGLMGAALLFNSVTQEVLVRGYVLQTIESQFNTLIALVVSSVFFTALHAGAIAGGGILPAINLLAAGVVLGLAYTTTGNLWLPIGLHFSWNFLQGPVLGIAVSGQALDSGWKLLDLTGPAIFTGGAFGLEGGLIATLVTSLGIGAMVAAPRCPRDETS